MTFTLNHSSLWLIEVKPYQCRKSVTAKACVCACVSIRNPSAFLCMVSMCACTAKQGTIKGKFIVFKPLVSLSRRWGATVQSHSSVAGVISPYCINKTKALPSKYKIYTKWCEALWRSKGQQFHFLVESQVPYIIYFLQFSSVYSVHRRKWSWKFSLLWW